MLFNTASHLSNQLVFANEVVEVWKEEPGGQHSTFSLVDFEPGDTICVFGASAILQTPSYLTIQVNLNEHICLQPIFLQYINHSCSPNIFFDLTEFRVLCIQPVMAGDELCYFYPSTEWEMAQPFRCVCGSNKCLGYINGASYLSKEELHDYKLSDFISQQLRNKYSK